ncbi:hypothetical protein CH63R_14579 [Colletotrichum higginsianum IMI 349063]|uniref:Uncharacterized protein n=1 Tax=Colletotrichum higginsianum (strain IMI 349063) TaxID=759273 RepID=A0A1B7XQH3_COLHI|nr:hypothetical protein CH63R_14579 [Colletotrichum higginsianum IMI 349063]OBR02007.1 hypothetical protein CH63R_14579 [Colletotrichum higginsianum IMI 349063]
MAARVRYPPYLHKLNPNITAQDPRSQTTTARLTTSDVALPISILSSILHNLVTDLVIIILVITTITTIIDDDNSDFTSYDDSEHTGKVVALAQEKWGSVVYTKQSHSAGTGDSGSGDGNGLLSSNFFLRLVHKGGDVGVDRFETKGSCAVYGKDDEGHERRGGGVRTYEGSRVAEIV